ncbi:MAG: aspartate aminotransferase family protein [Anaerostipes sp.]|uniref:aspartate aminotransferase family protein n=1 Tax=Anaerostipes sp. 992a TaxID=1261637 RepID=UPI000950E165|nr:aspartate aminotransferase family protein [Anaerostipes sp.]OLR62084.1 acetylornithine aminotransferase [Anaerostipes sp. 992a]
MISMKKYIDKAENYILKTYNRYPVVLDRGDGVYLYDLDGKKYLDFAAGIAVFALGYGNQEYNDALKAQIDKILHTSNLYYNQPAIEAAEKIVESSGMKKVFFTNSGTEAIEGALKVARKYAYNKDASKEYEIIAMNHSFHGRSQGALSVTGNSKYQAGFVPKDCVAVFADFNNLEDVKSKITDKTCGIICEVVQGEGGIYPADPEFLKGLRALCDEHDILLIFDEVQCGMGRCGSLYAHDLYGVKPDVMALAKALGCGVPVGAFVVGEKADGALVPGDHGTTYGGNPFATAAVSKVFDLFEKLNLVDHVNEIGAYLSEKLDELTVKYDCIKEHRGIGLMHGLECEMPVAPVITKAMDKGLIIINAGANILRFVPPLVIEKEHVDEMIQILDEVFAELS